MLVRVRPSFPIYKSPQVHVKGLGLIIKQKFQGFGLERRVQGLYLRAQGFKSLGLAVSG